MTDRRQKIHALALSQLTDLVTMALGAYPFEPDPNKTDAEEAQRMIRMLVARLDELKPMLGV